MAWILTCVDTIITRFKTLADYLHIVFDIFYRGVVYACKWGDIVMKCTHLDRNSAKAHNKSSSKMWRFAKWGVN